MVESCPFRPCSYRIIQEILTNFKWGTASGIPSELIEVILEYVPFGYDFLIHEVYGKPLWIWQRNAAYLKRAWEGINGTTDKGYCIHRVFSREGLSREDAQKLAKSEHKKLGGFVSRPWLLPSVLVPRVLVKVPTACSRFHSLAHQHFQEILVKHEEATRKKKR